MLTVGDYVIIYGNITKSKFKVGDTLRAGQVVGKVLKGDTGEYFLDFILMRKDKRIGAINWFKW